MDQFLRQMAVYKSLNWTNLIEKCNIFKNKLVEFREKDVSIFNNFKKTQ